MKGTDPARSYRSQDLWLQDLVPTRTKEEGFQTPDHRDPSRTQGRKIRQSFGRTKTLPVPLLLSLQSCPGTTRPVDVHDTELGLRNIRNKITGAL